MKQQYALGLLLLALVPACSKKKKPAKQASDSVFFDENSSSRKVKETFLDDAQEFVLVDEENPFTRTAKKGTPLVSDEEEDRAAYDRSEQAQYGLKTIYFEFDKFAVDNSQKPVLDEDVKKIKELTDKGYTIIVEGHACRSAGSAVYNMMLSEKRAQSVIRYLVKKGISKGKLKPVGRGFEMCIVQEGDRNQQRPNRRVEFRVLQ